MLQSTEQRAIAWTSVGLCAAVLLGWLVLFFGGEYLVGLIESGRGPLGHIKSLATRLLADVPNDQFAAALEFPEIIRVALDQEHVDHDQPVGSPREIALFPPMTGG